MVTAAERRQFALLARDSIRQLLNSAVLARDGDPWQFAIWATTLIQTPPTMYAIGLGAKYAALRRAPEAVVERVILADRLFFVFYAMVAAALLASLTWEALFPDRTDQEVVGALPVRPRTLAAARLSAALAMGLAFSMAISLPSTLLFSFFAAIHPQIGHIYAVFVGHLIGVVGGALSAFLLLLVVRGVTAVALTSSAANVLAGVLQLASVSGIIEAFLYVPSLMPPMVNAMLTGDADAMRLPPVWFAALYSVIAGSRDDIVWTAAVRAILALAMLLPAVVALYLLPSRLIARRALESSSKESTRLASALTRTASTALSMGPDIRPVLMFVIASFTRSRRHVLVVVTQLGIGLAIAAISIVSATLRRSLDLHHPSSYLLAVPLVLMFFTALGLRSAFVIPLEFEANWPFRVVGTDIGRAAAATRRAMLALAVLPTASLACIAALAMGWPAWTAISTGFLDVVAGALLVECVAYGWHAIPFAREHVFSSQSLKWRGLIMVVPLIFFAFVNSRVQMAALQSPRAAAWYVAVMAGLAIAVHRLSIRESRRYGVVFDDDGDSLAVLNLSNAM